MEKLIKQLHEFRYEADHLINSAQYLLPSREVSLAHTNLQRCKMWLGKVLQELKVQTPYPDSENPANKTIEPQADHTDNSLMSVWKEMEPSQTVRVKHFRARCEELARPMNELLAEPAPPGVNLTGKASIILITATLALEEAKMWLGWELDRIRKIKEHGEPVREMIRLEL